MFRPVFPPPSARHATPEHHTPPYHLVHSRRRSAGRLSWNVYASCEICLLLNIASHYIYNYWERYFINGYCIQWMWRRGLSVPFMHLSVSYQMMARKYSETCRTEYNRMKSCCFFFKFFCSEHMARLVHVFVLMMRYQLHILHHR